MMIYEEKVLDALGIDVLTPRARETLENVLVSLERATDRYFHEPQEISQDFYGMASRPLYLRETPIIDEDSDPLRVLTIGQFTGSPIVLSDIDSTDYELVLTGRPEQPPIIRHLGSGWPSWTLLTPPRANIRATYWAGYTAGQLPGDIERIVLRKTRDDYSRATTDTGLKKETIGRFYSYERFEGGDTTLQDDWDSIVSLWRVPVFA